MPNPFERSHERSSRLHLIAFTELGGVATSARMQRQRSILQSSDTSRLFRTRRPANKGKKACAIRVDILIRARRALPFFGRRCPHNLPPRIILLYRTFPDFRCSASAPPLSETDNDHYCRRRPRIPALPGRGCRIAAPDGAFGLFGDRYFPARTEFKRLGRLRQAAL